MMENLYSKGLTGLNQRIKKSEKQSGKQEIMIYVQQYLLSSLYGIIQKRQGKPKLENVWVNRKTGINLLIHTLEDI